MNTPEHNNFTILRLVLALLVVLGHFAVLPAGPPAYGIFGCADIAVDMFFVISGYLIYASFDRRPVIIDFYIRRLFRIYPLYITMIVLQGLVMAALLAGSANLGEELLRYLGFNMIMANFLAHDMGGLFSGLNNHGINPSLWTLKIELAFYFLMPILWYLTERFGFRFLALVFAASTAYALVFQHFGMDELAKQLPGQMRFFAAGMLLARYSHRLTFPTLPAAAVACGLFALWGFYPHAPVVIALYPVAAALIMYLCAFRMPYVPLKRDISYGVYLIHGPLIQISLLFGIFSSSWAFLALLVATVIFLALGIERLVEQPGIDFGKRLARAWSAHYGKASA